MDGVEESVQYNEYVQYDNGKTILSYDQWYPEFQDPDSHYPYFE
jgi:hypothetical protein